MTVSVSVHRELECPDCHHRLNREVWLVLDLADGDRYAQVLRDALRPWECQRCNASLEKPDPLLVVNLSPAAPLLLGLPQRLFATREADEEFGGVLRDAQARLANEGRPVLGPLLHVPYHVLLLAAHRDVELDCRRPTDAVREVQRATNRHVGRHYATFLHDLSETQKLRRVEAAAATLRAVTSEAALRAALAAEPLILGAEVRGLFQSYHQWALAEGDGIATRRAEGFLQLLRRCEAGDVAQGWAEFTAIPLHTDEVSQALHVLWESLREAMDRRNPAAGIAAGEELIAASVAAQHVGYEVTAALWTAELYAGLAESETGEELERACHLYERVIDLSEKASDQIDLDHSARTMAIMNLAGCVGRRRQGDPAANCDRAVALCRQALELLTDDEDADSRAMVNTNLGLGLLESSRNLAQRFADQEEVAARRHALIAEAIEHFGQALTWRTPERDARDWAFTEANLALAYEEGVGGNRPDELRRSIDHYTHAAEGFDLAGDGPNLSLILADRAAARGKAAAAEDDPGRIAMLREGAEEDARRALALVENDADRITVGRRVVTLAAALAGRHGYVPETIATYERSQELLTPETASRDCRRAGREFALMAVDAGDWRRAADAWSRAASAGLFAIRQRTTMSARLAEVSASLNLSRWAAYALFREGRLLESVQALERGRALQLTIWAQRDAADRERLRAAEPELFAEWVDLSRRIELGEQSSAAFQDAEFVQCVERRQALLSHIRSLPGFARFLEVEAFSPDRIGLQSDEVLAYPLTSPWGSAWLLIRQGLDDGPQIEAVELRDLTSTRIVQALQRVDLDRGVAEGYLLERATGNAARLDHELHTVSTLLGPELMLPLAVYMQRATLRSVCIVPIGVLAQVPLHALNWGQRLCLLDAFEISYAPSAHILQLTKQRAARSGAFDRLLSVGNPLPQKAPLQESEIEAQLVSSTLPARETVTLVGAQATKPAVLSEICNASHVHLACHGSASTDPLGMSASLYFAHDEPVTAQEILDLDLRNVRLVVASACETGMVSDYDTADEALALSTITLAAGAAGSVASFWRVNDFATRLLMVRFYEELVEMPHRPAAALRAAQLWLRDLREDDAMTYVASRPGLSWGRHPSQGVEGPGPWEEFFSSPTTWAAFSFNGA